MTLSRRWFGSPSVQPINGTEDIGGPDKISFADLARAKAPDKTVVVDAAATYFGTPLTQTSLVVTD